MLSVFRRWFARLVAGVLLVSFVAPVVSGGGEGEDPFNQDCAGVPPVALVCAGADAGTNGGCDDNNTAEVSCWYTYGWNMLSHSPAQLPGGGRLNWSYSVEYCLSGEPCEIVEAGGGSADCEWALSAAQQCRETGLGEGTLDFELALGQCVVVTAYVFAEAEAWGPSSGAALSAYAWDDSENGGAACFVDNGRD